MDRQTLLSRSRTDRGVGNSRPHLVDSRATCGDLLTAVLRLADAWRSRLAADFAPLHLNDSRFAVLQAIEDAGQAGCSQTDLARRLGNSESNISTLLNRMVADNLVERRRCSTDRRKSLIRLTETGTTRLEYAREQYCRSAGILLSGWPPSSCRQLMHQLTQVCNVLEADEQQPVDTDSLAAQPGAKTPFVTSATALSLHPETQSRLP